MNRFRNKKKNTNKDDSSTGRPSQEEKPSTLPSFKSFIKGKRPQDEEEKKEFDISTALPSTDDFRTSLLMTGLSARFSMLKEQDNPHTKIGKASDDSVLAPNRQSRLLHYGFSSPVDNLPDISEVESIKAPSSLARMQSFTSDDSDSTKLRSVMSRGRPMETNNLFGGRQKIYKIAPGAKSSRVVYDGDIAGSAFRSRSSSQPDGNRNASHEQQPESRGEMSENSRPISPLLEGYDTKRGTSSTVSSASFRARNSTAATSIASQPVGTPAQKTQNSDGASTSTAVERHVTRTRRLYETGLNQEPRPSMTPRAEILNRQRTLWAGTPDASPLSANFLDSVRTSDKRQILSKGSVPNLRSASPPATASFVTVTAARGKKIPKLNDQSKFGGSPPLSPPISDAGDHLSLSIQASGRGKATALGVFQKPTQAYDESKYTLRLMQLQHGREPAPSSALRSRSSSSAQRRRIHTNPAVEFSTPIQPSDRATQATVPFFDGQVDTPTSQSGRSPSMGHGSMQRPAARDHSALRQPPALGPLSGHNGLNNDVALVPPVLVLPNQTTTGAPAEDLPTHGPTPGLNGLVRQHLRTESDASSLSVGVIPLPVSESRTSVDPLYFTASPATQDSSSPEPFSRGTDPDAKAEKLSLSLQEEIKLLGASQSSLLNAVDDRDEFADKLATAAQRVRQRMTSLVESDSLASSPVLGSESPKHQPTTLSLRARPRITDLAESDSLSLSTTRSSISPADLSSTTQSAAQPENADFVTSPPDSNATSRHDSLGSTSTHDFSALLVPPNPLGIALSQLQSSRVSSVDRSRNFGSHPKPTKMIGLAGSTMSSKSNQPLKPLLSQSLQRQEAQPTHARDEYQTDSNRQYFESESVVSRKAQTATEELAYSGPRALTPRRQEGPKGQFPFYSAKDNHKGLDAEIGRSSQDSLRLRDMEAGTQFSDSTGTDIYTRSQSTRGLKGQFPGDIDNPSRQTLSPVSYSRDTLATKSPSRIVSPPLEANSNALYGNDALKKRVDKSVISDPTFIRSTSRVPARSLSQNPGYGDHLHMSTNIYTPPVPSLNLNRRREQSLNRGGQAGFLGLNSTETRTLEVPPSVPVAGTLDALSNMEYREYNAGRGRPQMTGQSIHGVASRGHRTQNIRYISNNAASYAVDNSPAVNMARIDLPRQSSDQLPGGMF